EEQQRLQNEILKRRLMNFVRNDQDEWISKNRSKYPQGSDTDEIYRKRLITKYWKERQFEFDQPPIKANPTGPAIGAIPVIEPNDPQEQSLIEQVLERIFSNSSSVPPREYGGRPYSGTAPYPGTIPYK